LGVVARHGRALHRARPPAPPASRLARYSVTRRRLASESRFASISLDAAAIERSTASRRSSRIAFSFSPSISLRARSSSCSYCSRAWASSVARSFSATVRAGARGRNQAFVLLQQASGLGAGPLRFLELLLDAALSLLHGFEEGGPAELPQQRQQDPEDDQGPEDQPRIDGERGELLAVHLEQLEQQRDHQRREAHAFDERGGQDHRPADV